MFIHGTSVSDVTTAQTLSGGSGHGETSSCSGKNPGKHGSVRSLSQHQTSHSGGRKRLFLPSPRKPR